MSHKVIPFNVPMFKVTPVVLSDNNQISKEDLKQYVEDVFICLKRTSCSKVTLSENHEYVIIYDERPFTPDDYQNIWFLYKNQKQKSTGKVIPKNIVLKFIPIEPPKDLPEYLEFIGDMAAS